MIQFSSVHFSHSVVSDSLRPHESARQASLSITNSQSSLRLTSIESVMPSSHLILCHPLLLLPSNFPALVSLPMNWLFASYGQSIGAGASASASVLLKNIQGWLPLGLTGWISLLSKGLSRVFSSTTIQKHQFFSTQAFWWSSSHICTWLLEKPQLWLYGYLSAKWLLICCLALLQLFFQGAASFNFMAAVTICSDFGAQENKISHCSHCFPIYLPWSDETRCHDICQIVMCTS